MSLSATSEIVEAELKAVGSVEKAAGMMRFFKTGPGQYGEGDIFLGVSNPETRKIARTFRDLPISEAGKILKCKYHEVRLCALLIMVEHYRKGNDAIRQQIFDVYLNSTEFINNWDLVDLSAPGVVGEHVLNGNSKILDTLAASSLLWDQRIAMVSTLTLIRHNQFDKTFQLAEHFLTHKHDLMHKAAGWMLREVGKRDRTLLTEFVQKYKRFMPRTMLRYAIEHYPDDQRREFLRK